MLGEVHGAMTNVDEGDEHQMERRLYGRRRLEKVHCDAKRKHKATLPETDLEDPARVGQKSTTSLMWN